MTEREQPLFPNADPRAPQYGRGDRYAGFSAAFWRRSLPDDIEALRKSWYARVGLRREQRRFAVLSLGALNRWLDGRDGCPSFATREATDAYVKDREEYARALIAAFTLAEASPE